MNTWREGVFGDPQHAETRADTLMLMVAEATSAPETSDSSARPAKRTGWRRSTFGTLGTGTALIAGQATTGLALLLLARRTTPSVFGAFAALYGVSTAVGGLIDFGSSSRVTIDLAQGANRSKFLPWLVRRTSLQVPMILVLIAVSLRFADKRLPTLCILFLCTQALTVAVAHGALGAVRVLVSPVMSEWMVFAGNLVTLLTVIVVPDSQLLTSIAIASSMSWVLCSALALRRLRGFILPWVADVKSNPWHGSASFGFASVAVVLQGFILVVVERSASSSDAGALGAVQKWTQPISLIALAYSGFLFPSLASALTDRAAIKLMRTLIAIFAFGAAVAAVIVVIAPEMVRILLGPEYAGAVHVLRMLVIVTVPELVVQPLSILLQARGLDRSVAWTMMGLSVGGLTAVAVLAPHIGNTSVPLVAGVSNGIALTVFGIATRRMWLRNRALVRLAD